MQTGRPSKFDTVDMEQVKFLAEKGFTDKELAQFFGVTEQTWNNWKKAHPDFFESLKNSKAVSDSKVVESLYNRAIGFTDPNGKYCAPDTTACIFWLKNRLPDQWRDKQQLDVNAKVGKSFEEQLEELE